MHIGKNIPRCFVNDLFLKILGGKGSKSQWSWFLFLGLRLPDFRELAKLLKYPPLATPRVAGL
jgi:hypothetical protein